MAESTIAGDRANKCIRLTCILNEGTVTVSSRVYSTRGLYETGVTFGNELQKGEPVAFSTETSNTYDNTGGLCAVTRISGGKNMVGRLVSEPQWVTVPSSTQTLWSSMLTNKYYRVATVEFPGMTNVMAVELDLLNAQTLTPGMCGFMVVSAASSYADHKIVISDSATVGNGAQFRSMTYRATAASGTYTHLIGAPTGISIPVIN